MNPFAIIPLRFWVYAAAATAAWLWHAGKVSDAYKSGKDDAIAAIQKANDAAQNDANAATIRPDFANCDPFKWNRKEGRCEP